MRDLTDEEVRILRAALEERMGVNEHGRYVIEGEKRPDRKAREAVASKGYLLWPHYKTRKSRITEKGRAALFAAEHAAFRREQQ